MEPIYDLPADVSWTDSDPNDWRNEEPEEDTSDDDEDEPTPDYVKSILGFDPDDEEWDDEGGDDSEILSADVDEE